MTFRMKCRINCQHDRQLLAMKSFANSVLTLQLSSEQGQNVIENLVSILNVSLTSSTPHHSHFLRFSIIIYPCSELNCKSMKYFKTLLNSRYWFWLHSLRNFTVKTLLVDWDKSVNPILVFIPISVLMKGVKHSFAILKNTLNSSSHRLLWFLKASMFPFSTKTL